MNLLDCLTLPTDSDIWGERIDNSGGELYFRDNGADVLAIAHLDYVEWATPRKCGPIVEAPQLDDRLGVWVLLNVLPKLGVKVDVLLTDCEEIGASTGQYFQGKEYNWMFQFDRRGSDVVMYQYDDPYYIELLENVGFVPGWGSFSDICLMDHLGIAGFNIGTGFHNEHTRKCHADLRVTMRQAKRFARFWQAHKREMFPYIEAQAQEEYGVDCPEANPYYDDAWWEIEQKARYYGYDNTNDFVAEGGLQLV